MLFQYWGMCHTHRTGELSSEEKLVRVTEIWSGTCYEIIEAFDLG
jgi:hypothetical protein